jgi:hypothetical protein
VLDQCSILFIKPSGTDTKKTATLRSLGFRVDESDQLPANEIIAGYHAVVVRPGPPCNLPMLGARLRAKPHFGRRVLLALVPDVTPDRDKREATLSGFDITMSDECTARDLAATILRLLRPFPEYRCLLRAPGGRRKAA